MLAYVAAGILLSESGSSHCLSQLYAFMSFNAYPLQFVSFWNTAGEVVRWQLEHSRIPGDNLICFGVY